MSNDGELNSGKDETVGDTEKALRKQLEVTTHASTRWKATSETLGNKVDELRKKVKNQDIELTMWKFYYQQCAALLEDEGIEVPSNYDML